MSCYKYTNSLANNPSGTGVTIAFYIGFTCLYIQNSYYRREIIKGNPASQWIESPNLYSASDDVGKWVHMEMSYTASTRTLRYFRNGLTIISIVLDADLDYSNPTPINVTIFDDINISELLITKECLHTANFAPPTEPYSWYNIKDAYRDIPTDKLHGYK